MKYENEITKLVSDDELLCDIELTIGEIDAYEKLVQAHDFLSKDTDYQMTARKWHGQQRDFYVRNLSERKKLLVSLHGLANERNLIIARGGDN